MTAASPAINSLLHLHSAGCSLLVEVTDGQLPAVVHWGAELEPQTAASAAELVRATQTHPGPNAVSAPPRVSLLPEHSTGWVGRPEAIDRYGADPRVHLEPPAALSAPVDSHLFASRGSFIFDHAFIRSVLLAMVARRPSEVMYRKTCSASATCGFGSVSPSKSIVTPPV